MSKAVSIFCICTIAICCLINSKAIAYEVSKDEVFGASTEKVFVKNPPNPDLIGFFKSTPNAVFAYALIERNGDYSMYVKIRGKYEGWATATINGNEISFGKKGKAKIQIDGDGSIHRIFNGQSTRLVKVQ